MKDPCQKVVAASALLLLVAALMIGYRVIQQLERMALAAAQKKAAAASAQVQDSLRQQVDDTAHGAIVSRLETADEVPVVSQQLAHSVGHLPEDRSLSANAKEAEASAGTAMPGDGARDSYYLIPELPRPLFVGIPLGVEEGVRVPCGTRLLSANKPVNASDEIPVHGEFAMATDGVKSGEDESFLMLDNGPQWIQIDLEAEYAIHAIAIWHYLRLPVRAYHDVVVLLSQTADFSAPKVVFNNDAGNTLGLGEGPDKEYLETDRGLLVGVGGVRARYLRLHSNGNTANTGNQYVEVEVYGLPTD